MCPGGLSGRPNNPILTPPPYYRSVAQASVPERTGLIPEMKPIPRNLGARPNRGGKTQAPKLPLPLAPPVPPPPLTSPPGPPASPGCDLACGVPPRRPVCGDHRMQIGGLWSPAWPPLTARLGGAPGALPQPLPARRTETEKAHR